MTDEEINAELNRLNYDAECSCGTCSDAKFIAHHFANLVANRIREEDAELCDAAFRCRPATTDGAAMIYSTDLAAEIRARKTK